MNGLTWSTFAFIYISSIASVETADPLGSYNVDSNKVSISGVSSGAAMATQMHVIHSRDFMGVGIIAGVPYACAGGNAAGAVTCMTTPILESISTFQFLTLTYSLLGNVDTTDHMTNDKVYIFNGKDDSLINPGNGLKIGSYYTSYVINSNVKTELDVNAEHCMPTDNYGGNCNVLETTNYLNNCGYNAAFELLNWIYGDLEKPTNSTQQSGQLKTFNQTEFFYLTAPATYSFDTIGYVYMPSGCADKQTLSPSCSDLPLADLDRHYIQDEYVKHGGYNEVGELNNIIILYPQIIPILTNLNGCWDWFGYTGANYATKSGFQITALDRMRRKIMGQ